MSYYDTYRHLLGIPYDDGDRDCYGLCRRYYVDCYDVELPNYARSASFFGEGIDLVTPFLAEEEFKVIDVSLDRLEPGDGLVIRVPRPGFPVGVANHVAVFVGNHTFLHHMLDKPSSEEYLTDAWRRRILFVVRNPAITAANAERVQKNRVNFLDLVPDHVKQRIGLPPPSSLE